ncbi:hypothetical protein DSO57_1022281 [Entomophthora muscae]|uniref:Uncharacterized protein n=1 Tax=Entomophthora muscae TaxID=34485 RepID=A0ACC2S5C6_9FUNG|nr:hypothetical protein DSO57_1022281 [Entomophthora muscae]
MEEPNMIEERVCVSTGLMLVGMTLMFLGNQSLRFVVFLGGAGLCSSLVYYSVCILWPDGEEFGLNIYIAIGVAAVVGGLLGMCYRQLGVVLVGGLLGVGIEMLLIRAGIFQLRENQVTIYVLLVGSMALLAYLFPETILVLASSFIGALLFVLGVDLVACTGFGEIITKYRTTSTFQAPDLEVWIMLLSVCILAAIGILAQLRISFSVPDKRKPNV